jgi:hypothetical protein
MQGNRLKTIVIAVMMIGFEIFMIISPGAADGATVSGRNSAIKSLIIAIWGIPGGIGLLLVGGLLGFFSLKKPAVPIDSPELALETAQLATPAARPVARPKSRMSKEFAAKVAPRKIR